jgi:nucleoid-associated protein YgaU
VTEPMPARLLCAQVYGAAAAEERARQVVELNRIRTPGRIPPGTTLKMPAVPR